MTKILQNKGVSVVDTRSQKAADTVVTPAYVPALKFNDPRNSMYA